MANVGTDEPRGRLSTRARSFERVVADLRHVVFAVIRTRPLPDGRSEARPLGSGFFVSRDVFLTCNHVIDGTTHPHQDGDGYLLVSNLGETLRVHTQPDVRKGRNLHLYPDDDVALLRCEGIEQRPFAAISYGFVREGLEIGVAGYPIPELKTTPDDELAFPGLIYRVARSVVTARYQINLESVGAPPMTDVPAIEVNFLFVPGNSGGPIFDAEHGQVLGFVHGFRHFTVSEKVAEAKLTTALPNGLGRNYIENLSGIYSIGIKLDRVRPQLETFGVLL